jgi:uncharacterized membrane protein SirB2
MLRKPTILRLVLFVAAIPFLAIIITNKEPDWLYYSSFGFIILAALTMQYLNWKDGKQTQVKSRLITYGLVVVFCIVLALLMNR